MCEEANPPSHEMSEVVALAHEVQGMSPFFSLLGQAIQHGRSKVAYGMLLECGLSHRRAWSLVDGWQGMIINESLTGWTPECVAMGHVIDEVSQWWTIPWSSLICELTNAG